MQRLPALPGYDLLRPLGGGPLTEVYSARCQETDADCAVKLLRPEWADDPTAVKLLQREARAGLKVRHTHLVELLDVHVTRGPYFLVMELYGGESLRQRLRRDYRLPLREALWIARQTAEALAALHRGGFIHGDVKPDNVHLVESGEVRLLDLGFAHRPGENALLLERGYVLGTPDYLAPELCGSVPDADLRSDLFSLGVMLFEMLTGQMPYPRGSLNQTFRRHECDPPADVRRLAGPLPSALVSLVERLLQRRSDQRPRAQAVVQQLIALEIGALSRRAA